MSFSQFLINAVKSITNNLIEKGQEGQAYLEEYESLSTAELKRIYSKETGLPKRAAGSVLKSRMVDQYVQEYKRYPIAKLKKEYSKQSGPRKEAIAKILRYKGEDIPG